MIPAPLPPDEAARLVALSACRILDTLPEEKFDGVAKLASLICGTPIALVSLIDDHRQWFKSRVGLEATETPRDFAFCAHAILDTTTMVVPDAHQDERFHDNPLVVSEPFVRFYAGAPLVLPGGERLGTLCVIDHEPRSLSSDQIASLETLAHQVASQLQLRREITQLDHARAAHEQAEQGRRESEIQRGLSNDRFQTLSDAAPIGIFETDVQGLCLYTNRAWQEVAGLSFEDSLGTGWTSAIHPDDLQLVYEEWAQAVDEKREFELCFRFQAPDGRISTVDSRARAIAGADGVPHGYVGTVKDITATRQAEEALRASQHQLERVLEGSTDGFWDWNLTTGQVEISRRLAEMLGYSPDDVESNAPAWEALVHPEDEPLRRKLMTGHLEGRLPHYETEHRKRTKAGGWKWILTRGKVTERDSKGRPLRMAGTHTDIDDRKHAEEALDRFFSLTLDLLCVAGLDGYLKRVNPAFEITFGYTTEELLSRPLLEFIHPEDHERTLEELSRLGAGGVTTRFEVRWLCRDGSSRWTTWTATPHAGERLIYAAGRDVTEERLASRAIAESEERYRDLFENATDMIQSVDATGKFLYVNRAWLQTLGYESADLRSLTMFDVIDPEYLEHCREMLGRVMSGQPLPKVVTVFRTRSGERRIVEGTVNCRHENGRPVSTRGIFRDVTEQKKTEEVVRASESAMRSIIRSSLSGIATFHPDGLIESVNPAAERILGYRAEELVGRNISILLASPPEDIEGFQRTAVHEALGRVTEWDVIRGDGRTIQIELALFEFQTARGKQLAADIQDISQRREVERMKREFVATISHELRTPLTSIRGSLDLLQGNVFGALTPPAAEVVTIAHRNTTRLIGLINDILDLDRLDSGKLELALETTEVETLFRGAIDAVKAHADQSNVRIAHEPTPAILHADANRMLQVMVNLLSNAVKFSAPGTKVLMTAAEEGEDVVIRVRDEGRGIPRQYLERVFDRFQQVEASDARSKSGSGLGLAISRAIIEQHGGTIGVWSAEGAGSTFWIRLPRGTATPHAIGSKVAGLLVQSAETSLTLEKILHEEGFSVAMLATAHEARAAFRGGRLSLLVVEIDEEDDGAARLSSIRDAAVRGDTPIIVLAKTDVAIEWYDDNLTVLLSGSDRPALLEAIRKLAGDASAADVVIVEDDPTLLDLMCRQLERDGMRVRAATTGGAAIAMIRKSPPRLIVLDVSLPDIDGFDVVSILHRDPQLRRLPLLVYSGRSLDSDDRERLLLGTTRFLTKASSDDQEFRKVVADLIRSAGRESTG